MGERVREREGRWERDFLIEVERDWKESVVACGSVRDWDVRYESKPMIGVVVVAAMVVVISATSVSRNRVAEGGMLVFMFMGLVFEAFECVIGVLGLGEVKCCE